MTEAEAKRLKHKLRYEAAEKFPDDKTRQNEYIFGTLRRLGWKPRRERVAADDEGDHEYR